MPTSNNRARPAWLRGDPADYERKLDQRPWRPPVNEVERLVRILGGPSWVCRIRIDPDRPFCRRQTVHKWIKQGYVPNVRFARKMLELAEWPAEKLLDIVR